MMSFVLDRRHDPISRALAALSGVRHWFGGLSLARQFFLASLAVLTLGMLLTGAWVGDVVEKGVLTRSAALSALYVESVLGDHLAALANGPSFDATQVAAFDRLLTETPLGQRVVGGGGVYTRNGGIS
jgi:hypothetical protein